jgi:two-component system phosphate regulon response regulator PhoB
MTEPKLVLIADDDANIRLLVTTTLASDRYSVIEAADGREAWLLIRERRPDVVILDSEMPVYTGLELSAVIKGDPQVRDTGVIMLAESDTRADREAAARAEADLCLAKPFSRKQLMSAVQQTLGLH